MTVKLCSFSGRNRWFSTMRVDINIITLPFTNHKIYWIGYEEPDDLRITLATIMMDVINEEEINLEDGILHHQENVDLLPANIELSALEVTMGNVMSREMIMKEYIDAIRCRYDYILIDCMPSLGMMTINALVSSDSVLIPVQAAYLPVKGLQQLIKTILTVKKRLNRKLAIEGILEFKEDMKMSENNDFIQLPPLKKDTPSDVVAFIWEYMKIPENSREKVKDMIKEVHENGMKLDYKEPKLYDVVSKEEIAEFEEGMRKTIADIVSEASGVACWVYVQKYVKHKTLDEMLQEWSGAGQFILAMDTWFERLMADQ